MITLSAESSRHLRAVGKRKSRSGHRAQGCVPCQCDRHVTLLSLTHPALSPCHGDRHVTLLSLTHPALSPCHGDRHVTLLCLTHPAGHTVPRLSPCRCDLSFSSSSSSLLLPPSLAPSLPHLSVCLPPPPPPLYTSSSLPRSLSLPISLSLSLSLSLIPFLPPSLQSPPPPSLSSLFMILLRKESKY